MIPYLHLWSFNLPTFGLMLWLAAVYSELCEADCARLTTVFDWSAP